jgi:glutathione-specific gamma-glutamylcyclotransferase
MTALSRALIASRLPPSRTPRRPPPTVSEALLRAGLRRALESRPAGGPIRVFAYGALMWERDAVPGGRVAPATLRGFVRRWCLRDIHNRGTPEAPALTLGLEPADPEARCDGLLYTLPAETEEEALWSAWRHEMTPGFYRHAWVAASGAAGGPTLPALTFVANPRHPLYAGALPEGEREAVLAAAVGPQGPAADYLLRTAETLRAHGLRDPLLDRLAEAVVARLAAMPEAGAA